ncbi:histidine phosphatase family protein [Cellulomonas sp. RIT-PI-Y]|uniref:histidine phosphatase family protein n=1 Tax=Cellulomonas sp. RIT-PI-Y TaxID=3035297 RepID=UPI0021D97C51|nr:histidine phosphatase family protein [Cellulomonas sp. RIT-PI-Y]
MVSELWLVRHGESTGNVAATRAERSGEQEVGVLTRDADTPLSENGRDQAAALGTHWADARILPQSLWCSPYQRARETARIAQSHAGITLPTVVDERLRDRELGVVDGLTSHGIRARWPQEAARRDHLGKFYYRPPGGESWADVALRLRSALRDIDDAPHERVLIVAHDAVIWLLRYVLEGLDEEGLFDLIGRGSVRNTSVTVLTRGPEGWAAQRSDDVRHLAGADAEVTEHAGSDEAEHGRPAR